MDIIEAIARRDMVTLRELLDSGTPLDEAKRSGVTPIEKAVDQGDLAIVDLLLQRGASIDDVREGRLPVLLRAVANGAQTVVERLLNAGADPTVRGPLPSGSALHYVSSGRKDAPDGSRLGILETFLKLGLDPDQADEYGWTPLHSAAAANHGDLVERLIVAGCRLDPEDRLGRTPLSRAVGAGATVAIRSLLDAGANVDHESVVKALSARIRPKNLSEVIEILEERIGEREIFRQAQAVEAAATGDLDRLREYLQGGGDPSTPLRNDTPLEWAVYERQIGALHMLVDAGASVDKPEWLLQVALLHERDEDGGFLEGLRILIDAGVDLESPVEPKYEPPTTALGYCVRHKLDAAFDLLLEEGADVHRAPERGKSALWWAACLGRRQLLERLSPRWREEPRLVDASVIAHGRDGDLAKLKKSLESGGDPNSTDHYCVSALSAAAWNDHPECVEVLLAAGADPKLELGEGSTAKSHASEACQAIIDAAAVSAGGREVDLFEAARSGDLERARTACNRGVLPDIRRGNPPETPMMVAAGYGHGALVDYLIEAGASVNPSNCVLETPLTRAGRGGHVGIVRRLLEAGAETSFAMESACGEQDAQFLGTLLRGGIGANLRTNTSRPLLLAVSADSLRNAEVLLDHGADIETAWDGDCVAPLYRAVVRGNEQIVELLLGRGADPNHPPGPEWTTLMVAAQLGHQHVVELLLKAGADAEAPEAAGSSALALAIEAGHVTIAASILKRLSGFDELSRELMLAALFDDPGAVSESLVRGASPDTPEPTSMMTAMHVAAAVGCADALPVLAGKSAFLDGRDFVGRTPLHLAAASGRVRSVRILAEYGAALEAVDSSGRSALHHAVDGSVSTTISEMSILLDQPDVRSGNEESDAYATVDALIELGAPADTGDHHGTSPLHLAAALGDAKIVKRLLECGVPLDVHDRDNETPISRASAREVVDILVRAGARKPDEESGSDDQHDEIYRHNSKRLPRDLALALSLAPAVRRRLPIGPCRDAVGAMVRQLAIHQRDDGNDAAAAYSGIPAALFSALMESKCGYLEAFASKNGTRRNLELKSRFIRMFSGPEF